MSNKNTKAVDYFYDEIIPAYKKLDFIKDMVLDNLYNKLENVIDSSYSLEGIETVKEYFTGISTALGSSNYYQTRGYDLSVGTRALDVENVILKFEEFDIHLAMDKEKLKENNKEVIRERLPNGVTKTINGYDVEVYNEKHNRERLPNNNPLLRKN